MNIEHDYRESEPAQMIMEMVSMILYVWRELVLNGLALIAVVIWLILYRYQIDVYGLLLADA